MEEYDKSMEYISQTQTLVGKKKRELVDTETGETILVDQITKRTYGTRNFWKCYLMDFCAVLGIIDSKQLDVFIHIAEHTNPSDNIFIATYKDIARDVGVSQPTISAIMRKLQDNNFIRKKQNGVWLVNPNVLMKGNDHKRQILLSYYESTNPPTAADTDTEVTVKRSKRKSIPTTDTDDAPVHTGASTPIGESDADAKT